MLRGEPAKWILDFIRRSNALAAGDVATLTSLLNSDPALARARSECDHPTLLQCLVLTTPPVDHLEELIDLLADRGAELTDPLVAACGCGNVRAVTKLLDLGGNIEGNGRWSPLEEALYFGQEAVLTALLQRGATVNNLRTAAGVGDQSKVAGYFDANGDLTEAAGAIAWPFGKPIAADVRRNRLQMLTNALVYAASWGRIETATFLLDHGAVVNLIPAGFDYSGTALHYAAFQGRREMVDLLLRRGADPSVRDTKIDALAEDWAEHSGHHELAARLRNSRQVAR